MQSIKPWKVQTLQKYSCAALKSPLHAHEAKDAKSCWVNWNWNWRRSNHTQRASKSIFRHVSDILVTYSVLFSRFSICLFSEKLPVTLFSIRAFFLWRLQAPGSWLHLAGLFDGRTWPKENAQPRSSPISATHENTIENFNRISIENYLSIFNHNQVHKMHSIHLAETAFLQECKSTCIQ